MDDSWEWRYDRSLGCFVRPGRRPGSQERWWPTGAPSVVRAYFFDPRTGLRGLPPPEPVAAAAGAPGPGPGGERDGDPDGRLAWGL